MISIDRSIDEGRAASVRKRWKASRKRALKSRAAIANAMGILQDAGQWQTETRVTVNLAGAKKVLEGGNARLHAMQDKIQRVIDQNTDSMNKTLDLMNAMTKVVSEATRENPS